MKLYENCSVRKKSIKSGIGDCGKYPDGYCRGYTDCCNHDEPTAACQRCPWHYSQKANTEDFHPSSWISQWEEVQRAARLLKEKKGRIMNSRHGKFVKPY